MHPERNGEIPSGASDWHPPQVESEIEGGQKIDAEDLSKSHDRQNALQNQTSLERFQPTPENPIQEVRIGLWQTMGHVDRPTRVIMTLKDGNTADMPWEQAEALLPPEFRTARELGEKARDFERKINIFATAIRAETDVMARTGHVKDALLRPLGQTRKPVRYLNDATDLAEEISNIAQQSFLELRRMTNTKESHAEELRELSDQLENCQQRFDQLRETVAQDKPSVLKTYESFTRDRRARLENSEDNRPGLPDPDGQ